MDVTKIEVNKEYKNKGELCDLLGIVKAKGGRNIKLQDAEIARFIKLEKTTGYKVIVTEIYSIPLPKINGRKGNCGTNPNSHGNNYIETEQWKCDKEDMNSIGVYKIVLDKQIYIGSTTAGFRQRFIQHRSDWNPLSTKELLDNGGVFSIVKKMNGCTEENIRKEEECYIQHYLNRKDWDCINLRQASNYWEKEGKSNMKDIEYNDYVITNKYMANGLAFLGFRYYKHGFGQDTVYKFADTEEFRQALTEYMRVKKEFGKFLA